MFRVIKNSFDGIAGGDSDLTIDEVCRELCNSKGSWQLAALLLHQNRPSALNVSRKNWSTTICLRSRTGALNRNAERHELARRKVGVE